MQERREAERRVIAGLTAGFDTKTDLETLEAPWRKEGLFIQQIRCWALSPRTFFIAAKNGSPHEESNITNHKGEKFELTHF